MYNPKAPFVTRKCKVYGLDTIWRVDIQLQQCPACKFWGIGPDCRDLGIFNLDNRILVTHHVLDDYTNAFTASETPFAAWITCISRRYLTLSSSHHFMDPKRFRDAWFAYTKLIQFEDDMICPQCGPNPSAIIWDGVSISFNRKKALPSLRPPTTIRPESAVYDETVRVKETQWIIDRGLRKRIREIINGPPLSGSRESNQDQQQSGSDSDAEIIRKARAEALVKKREGLKKRFMLIPSVITELTELDDALGGLFRDYFGTDAVLNKISVPHEYKQLFLQVRHHTIICSKWF